MKNLLLFSLLAGVSWWGITLLIVQPPAAGAATTVTIEVDGADVIHETTDQLLGEAVWASYQAYSWDFERQRLYPEAQRLISELRMGLLGHYPGVGVITHDFNWKNLIGPVESRKDPTPRQKSFDTPRLVRFGPDEYGRLLQQYRREANPSAEGSIQVNIVNGTAEEAADWVEYMNAPNDGSNPGGGTDWARVRADNGHPEPYRIKYWEFGNEPHFTAEEIGHLTADEYVKRSRDFSRAMKARDRSIEVMSYVNTFQLEGIEEIGKPTTEKRTADGLTWTEKVIREAGTDLDYLYFHWYGGWNDRRTSYEFMMTSMRSGLIPWIDRLLESVDRHAANDTVRQRLRRIFIPEWHVYGGWAKPISGGTELKGAVAASRILHVMVERPEVKGAQRLALLAPYPEPRFDPGTSTEQENRGWRLRDLLRNRIEQAFDVREGYFAIHGREDGSDYVKTAVYYMKKLWSEAFQPQVLNTTVRGGPAFDNGVRALDVAALRSRSGDRLNLVVTNGARSEQALEIEVSDFSISGNARLLVLSGDSPEANNSWSDPDKIRISESQIEARGGRIQVQLPECSIAAVMLER